MNNTESESCCSSTAVRTEGNRGEREWFRTVALGVLC